MTQKWTLFSEGFSLWPLVRTGQALEFSNIQVSKIKVSDLVLFQSDKLKICHRVLRIRRKGTNAEFFIKGDAVAFADGWISEEYILGKLTKIDGQDLSHFHKINQFLYRKSVVQWWIVEKIFLSRFGSCATRLRQMVSDRPLVFPFIGLPVHRGRR